MKVNKRTECRYCHAAIPAEYIFCKVCKRDRFLGIQQWEYLIFGFVSLIVVVSGFSLTLGWIGNKIFNSYAVPQQASETIPAPIKTYIAPTDFSTNTPAITSTPTPFPDEFIDDFGASMRLIQAGEFTMGGNGGYKDERPIHTVNLDSYYIDKYEVTNVLYEACVNDGVCDPPKNYGSGTRSSYYDDSQYSDYPVLYVDWYQSKTYCEWRGARLPTEAEWEKAARGINEYMYPWGNGFLCSNGNFDDMLGLNGYVISGGPNCDGYEDTAPVGSFGNGRSPFGVYNMAGNVWEWVSDWYGENYYANSSNQDPQGPSSGNGRVIRGGAWDVANKVNLLTTRRLGFEPSTAVNYLGFRCARSLP